MDVRIPNLAEGVNSGTVVSISVKEGEPVKKGQTLMELETEKAVAPIPSPCDGMIQSIEAAVGDAVAVGKRVMVISETGATGDAGLDPAVAATPFGKQDSWKSNHPVSPVQVLQSSGSQDFDKTGLPLAASPAVRKLALELGIDLGRVPGTAGGGRITIDDVRAYVQALLQNASGSPAGSPAIAVDFSRFGPVTRKPITSLRKKIGEKMVQSWQAIPHVTQFGEADATKISELRKQYAGIYEQAGARLTLTVFILKVLASLLKKYPVFNSSLDDVSEEIVYKDYCHIGVAVDTEQGLIVPVIRDADKKNLVLLSKEISELAEKTRSRKVTVEDMQGGTFTLSNQGGIGGSFFTPIINRPEVAILGIGQAAVKPVAKNGQIMTASMMPLGLSYDHRVIDGGSAARFMVDLIREIENFDENVVRLV